MTIDVPQSILDDLTDVDMPRLNSEPAAQFLTKVCGITVPVYICGSLVVGSGAAGLRAAVEMKRRGVDVAVVSQSAWGGTSACSGSDKQTLHTANTAGLGDNFATMGRALRAGGAMDEDTAYIEAVGSGRAMASLQYLGLPLPQDALGGTLRYQTDHDDIGRATSCGPRTSRLMVKVLAYEALRLDIPFYNQMTVVKILTDDTGGSRRAAGVLAIGAKDRTNANPYGFAVFQCDTLVLAAGGPGELYRDSVFPNGCFGALGLALEAGIPLVNLTESQFGIGTRREGFPWNLSGTYVQTMPFIYSVDESGNEHNFLADYYRTTQELASNIFRKGYQWPFHASRTLDFGSSLIDLAIVRESGAGRRVFMDFNRNPAPAKDGQPFSLGDLDPDVSAYLASAGADQAMPIDRLRHMNPLAIELYRRYKIDIATEPLEFAVNHQHMNGGIAVDVWGQSALAGCYAIGEAAGTHGVTRPGGAALNAGQVFGTRVAEHVAARHPVAECPPDAFIGIAGTAIADVCVLIRPDSPFTPQDLRDIVQARMSDKAGLLCRPDDVSGALVDSRRLNDDIRAHGLQVDRPGTLARAIQRQHMALVSEAVLAALDHYIRDGGGSRGARAICDPGGACLPQAHGGPLEIYRFRAERSEHRAEQIRVRLNGTAMEIDVQPTRKFDETARPFFERDWPDWLSGRVFSAEAAKDGPC